VICDHVSHYCQFKLNFCQCSFVKSKSVVSNLYHVFITHALHLVPRVNLILHTLLLMHTHALDLQMVMLASFVRSSLTDILLLKFLVPFWSTCRWSTRLCFRTCAF
jgi:hypothetical protein